MGADGIPDLLLAVFPVEARWDRFCTYGTPVCTRERGGTRRYRKLLESYLGHLERFLRAGGGRINRRFAPLPPSK